MTVAAVAAAAMLIGMLAGWWLRGEEAAALAADALPAELHLDWRDPRHRLPVVLDETMPPGTVELRDGDEVVGQIVSLG